VGRCVDWVLTAAVAGVVLGVHLWRLWQYHYHSVPVLHCSRSCVLLVRRWIDAVSGTVGSRSPVDKTCSAGQCYHAVAVVVVVVVVVLDQRHMAWSFVLCTDCSLVFYSWHKSCQRSIQAIERSSLQVFRWQKFAFSCLCIFKYSWRDVMHHFHKHPCIRTGHKLKKNTK